MAFSRLIGDYAGDSHFFRVGVAQDMAATVFACH